MAVIERICTYPINGARPIEYEPGTQVTMDGLSGSIDSDRNWIFYDPSNMKRLSSKPNQLPGLARIQPILVSSDDGFDVLNGVDLFAEDGRRQVGSVDMSNHLNSSSNIVEIDEFGQEVSLADCGDDLAIEFSSFLGKDVRLGRRLLTHVPLDARMNRPLHIVSSATVDYISTSVGLDPDEVVRRIRANWVVGVEHEIPNAERNWLELNHAVGSVVLVGDTKRCPVPSQDSYTGKGMKDVVKVYRDEYFRSQDKKGTFIGAYGYFLSNDNQVSPQIEVGSEVEFVNK